MNWTEINETLSHLADPIYIYAAAVALALALFLILLVRRQPKKIVAYRTENGRVTVSRSAIVELVRTSCEQLNDVAKPGVRINVKGKYTHFDVRIQLTSGARLKDIEETLQSHLRQALTENLGIENLGKINIVATGFKSGRIQVSSPITTTEKLDSTSSKTAETLEVEETESLQNELDQKPL